MSIRIITDSTADLAEGQRPLLTVLPLTVHFGETEYLDGVNLSHREFYEKLIETDELPSTSQVPPYLFAEAYRRVQLSGDTAVVITISSKLSGTYQSAVLAAEEFQGTVFVVDSESVAVGEGILVEYALTLATRGLDAPAIAAALEIEKRRICILALLDTLEYLKRGGRISKAAALAGGLLSIKPVVSLNQGEVILLGKARGSRQGNNILVQQIESHGGVDFHMPLLLGYTGLSDTLLQKYIQDSQALWRGKTDTLPITTVGCAVGTHVGPGAIAVAFFHQ